MKIIVGNKVITRKELFKKKERFHQKQARLPIGEKIKILVRLQKIANSIKSAPGKSPKGIWKI